MAQKLTAEEIAEIVERDEPGFRVAASENTVRRPVVPGTVVTPGLDVLRRRFGGAAARRVPSASRQDHSDASTLQGTDATSNFESVVIEPKHAGGQTDDRRSVVIDRTTKRIVLSQD